MPAVRRSVTLVNSQGLHARPISKMIEIARRHKAELFVTCAGVRANGRRVLEMLSLAAPPGAVLEFEASGEDAEPLVEALERLIAERFGED